MECFLYRIVKYASLHLLESKTEQANARGPAKRFIAMKELSCSSGNNVIRDYSDEGDRLLTLSQLGVRSWWAAVILFTPWLLTFFFCWSILQDNPIAILTLLPGLVVAIHLLRQLFHHLSSNHPPLEENLLFPTLGAANWITLLRAGAIVTLAGFLPMAIQGNQGPQSALPWLPGLLYIGVSLADLLDGFIARIQGRETELGKKLDIETDAAGLLVASLVAVTFGRLPVFYLLVGLAYYPFIFGIWLRRRRGLPVIALQSRPNARIIAGCQMGLAGIALLPIFRPTFIFIAAGIFMTPLLLGFLRDWLVVSCRLQTPADPQTDPDLMVKSLMVRVVLAFRLILLVGGIIMLIDFDLNQTPLPWRLAASLCCLLAATGFAGRSASLCLILLLGSTQAPYGIYGITTISLVIFCAATVLVLSGTGILSLWTPEEKILYRGNNSHSLTNASKIP
jgi:CDP-diacylglycerol---glycerol-3-phosphate 3-phosphatidyltransferase